jgi:RNA polymerase II subunit A small phosphatase-like protein
MRHECRWGSRAGNNDRHSCFTVANRPITPAVHKLMDQQLLILDLDETLVFGAERPLDRACDFRAGPYYVYKRPFLKEFLAAVAAGFELAVWSSASAPYVHAIVAELFPEPAALRFVWSRERCTQRLHPEWLDYYWLKNLKKVKRLGFDLERVLMIDDSPEKLSQHYGNHLRIAPYLGDLADRELESVLPFLAQLRAIENLRLVEKRNWRALSRAQA